MDSNLNKITIKRKKVYTQEKYLRIQGHALVTMLSKILLLFSS